MIKNQNILSIVFKLQSIYQKSLHCFLNFDYVLKTEPYYSLMTLLTVKYLECVVYVLFMKHIRFIEIILYTVLFATTKLNCLNRIFFPLN